MAIFGKCSDCSSPSGHDTPQPSHLQNTLKPSPKTNPRQAIPSWLQVKAVKSGSGVQSYSGAATVLGLHASDLSDRSPTMVGLTAVDTQVTRYTSCHRFVSDAEMCLGTDGQFLVRAQLCRFVCWLFALYPLRAPSFACVLPEFAAKCFSQPTPCLHEVRGSKISFHFAPFPSRSVQADNSNAL